MLKRGQVTIFLVVGIVILLLAGLFFYLFGRLTEAPLEVEEEEAVKYLGVAGSVQSFVEKCMEDTLDPAIYLLAIQGGVIYPKENNLILLTDHGLVNYAWMNGIDGISREKMEEDLATYLEKNIDFCLGRFETFEKQDILVTPNYKNMDAQITIQKSAIRTKLTLPLRLLLSNGDEQSLDTFSTQLSSSLGTMVEVIEALQFPDLSPEDFFSLPYQPAVLPFDESVVIYSLSKNEPDEPLNFMFAVRNDFPENKPPQLAFIPDQTFRVGDRWQEELISDDPDQDILRYSSDSDEFTITEDGTIDLEITTAGIFDVTFTVEDGRNGKDEQEVSILVLEKNEK
ncbi:MAG: hypothetical protein Q7S55_02695 [Nanoarchaeota archaeon]|nr:hypothetical protein [Nanoarchaeota archaeon]